MARISLKKIILRDKEIANILRQMIEQIGEEVAISDEKGKWILGGTEPETSSCHSIELNGVFLGKVYGTKSIKPIVDFIHFLVNREQERRKLGTEVLDLYREVNLMYNFTQKLAQTIDQKGIAQLALEEANTLIKADGGLVIFIEEEINQVRLMANYGVTIIEEEALAAEQNFYRMLSFREVAGIINDHKTENGQAIAILYSPLKVKNHILGTILLFSKSGNQYTAADLKLLATLSLQSAAAIESAILYEKNLKEAKEKEAAIRALHEITSRFVPNEFIDFLGYKEITQVALGDSVEKEVTVFFSDIRGYTSLAENMTPAENFKFVNSFNGRMGPIIMRNRGFVNQYLGDGIMAIFPFSPTDALKAAVEMHQELQRYNQERQLKKRSAIKIGIGLHTGPLIMGIIGDERRMDAATISDTVNTASRIESLTKYYGVNILLSEHSLIKIQSEKGQKSIDGFQLRYLGKVQVKGRQQAIMIHECFSGDLPEMIQFKNHTLTEFDAALQSFYNQDFTDAVAALNRVLHDNPRDNVATLFLNKTKHYILDGVGEDWTGVELMTRK